MGRSLPRRLLTQGIFVDGSADSRMVEVGGLATRGLVMRGGSAASWMLSSLASLRLWAVRSQG